MKGMPRKRGRTICKNHQFKPHILPRHHTPTSIIRLLTWWDLCDRRLSFRILIRLKPRETVGYRLFLWRKEQVLRASKMLRGTPRWHTSITFRSSCNQHIKNIRGCCRDRHGQHELLTISLISSRKSNICISFYYNSYNCHILRREIF